MTTIGEFFGTLGFKVEGQEAVDKLDKTILSIAMGSAQAAIQMEKLANALQQIKDIGTGKKTGPQVDTMSSVLKETKDQLEEANKILDIKEKTLKVENLERIEAMAMERVYHRIASVADTIAKKLEQMIKKSADLALHLKDFKYTTGLSTDDLQNWERMAKLTNSSVESIGKFVTGVQDAITDLRMGKAPLDSGWNILGIDPTKGTPFQILEQLKVKLQDVDENKRAVARRILEGMGADAQAFKMLNEMNALGKNAKELSFRNLTGPAAEGSLRFARAWANLKDSVSSIIDKFGGMMGRVISPAIEGLTKLTDVTTKFLNNLSSTDQWALGFIGIVGIITAKFLFLKNLLAGGGWLAKALGLKGVAKTIENIVSKMNLSGIWNGLTSGLSKVWSILVRIGTFIKGLFNFSGLLTALQTIAGYFLIVLGPLLAIAKIIKDIMNVGKTGENSKEVKETGNSLTKLVTQQASFSDTALGRLIGGSPEGRMATAGEIGKNFVINVKQAFTIDGSKDPAKVKDEISKANRETFTQAARQLPQAKY